MKQTDLFLLSWLKRIAYTTFVVLAIFNANELKGQCTWTWYSDADNDGFGTISAFTTTPCGDAAPPGYVANHLDCDDDSPNRAIWNELDRQISNVTGYLPEITVSSDSTPFIMYIDASVRITVSEYDTEDRDWHVLGAQGFSGPLLFGSSASMAMDDDTPCVSYATQSGSGELSVMRYTGATWVPVGTLPVVSNVNDTDIAIAGGVVYVAYTTNTSGTDDLYVLRFASGAWQVLGGGSLGIGINPRIDVDKTTGELYVAYTDYSSGSGKATVRKFGGGLWSTVGTPEFSTDLIEYLQMDIDDAGRVYVAYFDYGTFTIVVQRYGADWETTATNDVYNDYPSDLSLAVSPDGTPYVAYSYYNAAQNTFSYAVRRNGGGLWVDFLEVPVGRGEGSAVVTGDQLSLAIAPDGIPYIAFRDIGNSDYVSVMQWGPVSCPLPLSLSAFTAHIEKPAGVNLRWTTVSEMNLDYFLVERMTDGRAFSALGHVAAQGNSQTLNRYSFTDQNPANGKNYYRLKSIDFDGAYTYSDLVFVDATHTPVPDLKIYPNPGAGQRISYAIGLDPLPTDEIQILNSIGQLIYEDVADVPGKHIEFNKPLQSGCYIFKYHSSGRELLARFIVF